MPMILGVKVAELGVEREIDDSFSFRYVLDNGEEITVPHLLAWCENCNAAVFAEQLPDKEKIQDRINQVRSGELDDFLNLKNNEDREENAKYHEKVLRWRESRSSPRKCLECGSAKVTELNEPEGWSEPSETIIANEQGEIRIVVELVGHKSIGGYKEIKFDAEGNKV